MQPIEIYTELPSRKLKGSDTWKSCREWRWRIKARNGRIIAASSEGFTSRAKCIGNLARLWDTMSTYDSLNDNIRDLTVRK